MTRLSVLILAGAAVAFGQAPAINPGGIQDAASQLPGRAVTAGSFVSIYGTALSDGISLSATIPLSSALNNVVVTFNGISAPLQFVAPTQINVQVPWDVLPVGNSGQVNVVVKKGDLTSSPEGLLIGQAAPGIYATADGWAIAIDVQDPTSERYGKIVAAPGAIAGLTTLPAQTGDYLLIYASGLGRVDSPVDAPLANGVGSDIIRNAVTKPTMLIGGAPANVAYAGLCSFVAVYQLNVQVPQIPASNSVSMLAQLNGINSQTVKIAVQ